MGQGPDQLRAATRKAAPMHGISHRLVSLRCRRAAEAAVGNRGVGRPTEVMIQAMVELKAEVAVEAEVAPQAVTPAVARDGTLEAEAPAGMGPTTPGTR